MPGWKDIVVLCSLLSAIGMLVDRFMLKRHKGAIYSLLYGYWFRLEEMSIPRIPAYVAGITLRCFSAIFGRRELSLYSFARVSSFSFVCTSGAYLLGAHLANLIFTPMPTIYSLQREIGSMLSSPTYWETVVVSLPFHVLTLLITWKALEIVQKSELVGLLAAVADLICAYILVSILHTIMLAASIIVTSRHPSPFEMTWFLIKRPDTFYAHLFSTWNGLAHDAGALLGFAVNEVSADSILATTTTLDASVMSSMLFIPTFVFMAMLFIITLSKLLLSLARNTFMYLIESATEEPDPGKLPLFSLLSALFSTLVILAKAVEHFS